ERKGLKIAFLAYTYGTNGLSLPVDSPFAVSYIDEEKIKKDISKADSLADIVVVSVHWGVEYQSSANDQQRALAYQMAKSGADIIFGHHPHQIQEVEMISNPDGRKTVVYYSLGNFISSQNKLLTILGGLGRIDLQYLPDEKQLSIKNASFIPLITHYNQGFRQTQVYPLRDYPPALADKHGIRKYEDFSISGLENYLHTTIDSRFLDYK
ncbi:MAG: CapA family protein, partial [Clostridiales bacterium]